ncbi:MAG: replication protein RepA [Acidobacteriota bacterium]|nr:replication protein RepA [Acidobacteriota bacterium]
MTNGKPRTKDNREGNGLTRVEAILPEILPVGLFDEVIRPEDVGYTHPVFLQCFMPVRHNVQNQELWQTDCGRASLLMRAGVLVNPLKRNSFKKCIVPAGPKARLISAYTNDYIHRYQTSLIPLGDSMRSAMERMNIRIGGANGKELQRELENFAAAEIILGVWDVAGNAHQHRAPVSETMSFWIEKNPNQQTFWQPEMTVSPQYFKAVTERDMAPFHWPALIGLQHNPRAMDIHAFLTYRMHKGLPRPVTLHAKVLHVMFGQGIKQAKHFWPRFTDALKTALEWYPNCRVEILNDAIRLHDSPPLIPFRKVDRLK